jgi:arsenite transporter
MPTAPAVTLLLAAAPCTAMVFVWSRLTDGDPLFTLSQVALNDTIMVIAFAPLVGLLLGTSAIAVPWGTLVTSVVLYIVIPVALAQAWRSYLMKRGAAAFAAALATVVGVLIEVPVMLLVVSVVNRSKGWHEHTGRPIAVKS